MEETELIELLIKKRLLDIIRNEYPDNWEIKLEQLIEDAASNM